jgi:hypothetical protein
MCGKQKTKLAETLCSWEMSLEMLVLVEGGILNFYWNTRESNFSAAIAM